MYFWAGIWKYYCHVSNQRPRIFLIPKFGAKIKILKFRTKNVLFEYFWAGTWKNCCHIWNQYPQICLVANYHEITKMHKFATKSALFGYFGLEFKKKLLSYLKSAPSNLSICKISRKNKKSLILGPKRPDLCIFWLEFESNIVIFEISTLNFF